MASMQDALFSAGLPKLVIDQNDIAGSWEQFKLEFSKTLQLKVYCAGKKKVTVKDETTGQSKEEEVDVFDNSAKCLALLVSLGKEGSAVLKSKGVDVHAADAHTKYRYEELMKYLQNHFEREESIYLQIHNFTHASQLAGEDNREFLRRVESLSRNLDFLKESEVIRETFLKSAVINGLRDNHLSRELMTKENLTFEKLNTILVNRSKVTECSTKLGKSVDVAKTYHVESRHSSHSLSPRAKRCFECGSYQHLARQCKERRCYICGSHHHIARDCNGLSLTQSCDRPEYSRPRSSRDYNPRSSSSSDERNYKSSYNRGHYDSRSSYSPEHRSHRDSNYRDNRDSRSYNSPDYRSSKHRDSCDYDYYKSDSYRRRSSSPTSSHKPSHPEKERRAERIEIRSISDGSIVERFQPSNWRSSHCYSRSPSPTHRRRESVSPRQRRGQSPYRLRPRVDVPSYYIREVRKKDGDIPYGK